MWRVSSRASGRDRRFWGDEAAVFAALGNGTVSVLDLSGGWMENEVAGGRNISLTLNKGGG